MGANKGAEEKVENKQPALTRPEYLKLLAACKRRNSKRLYLIVKLFGGAGLRPQELLGLTVEAVRQGAVEAVQGFQRPSCLPEVIWRDLLDYAEENHIVSGLVFTTRKGQPLNYAWVRHSITALALEARVDPSAATPRGLRKMYLATQENIFKSLRQLAALNYEWLLEQEQTAAGWNI